MRRTLRWWGSGSQAAAPAWLSPVPAVLLLALLAILVYVNSLKNGFVFDDLALIGGSSRIKHIGNLPSILGLTGQKAYRPIRTASYAIDYFFFGKNPAGYRAVNISLHVVNGGLLFFLFRTLLRDPRPALLGAILFVVHPIQTESVAYISGRRDVLFALFYLAGFASYVRYRETERLRHLFLAGFAYLLSLLSKEMGITLPVLCFCYDVVRSMPTREGSSLLTPWQAVSEGVRSALRRQKALYAVGGAVLLFALWYYTYYRNPSYTRKLYGGGLGPTLLTSARIFVHYLKLLVFPATLNADYSGNAFPVSHSLADARVIFALLILGGALWGIYRLLAEDRWGAFGGIWFFVTLLPVSQIVPHHEMVAEHYLYLPSAGLFLTAAVLLERGLALATERHKVAILAGFALVIASLGVRTIVRNRDWRDSRTLWTKTLSAAPGSARAHINVGQLALRQGRSSEAYRHFLEATRIEPNNAINRDNLGIVLLRHGLLDEAEQQFKEALRIRPQAVKSKTNLGLVYFNRGQLEQAENQFRAALNPEGPRRLRLRKGFKAMILNDLGIVLVLEGKNKEAEESFKEATRVAGDIPDAWANLGKLYLKKGLPEEAIAQLATAIRLNSSDARFHYMLGEAYYQKGEKELATLQLLKALSLRTEFPEARALLQEIYREKANVRGRQG